MTWAKFDDGYPYNAKLLRAGLECLGLDVAAICWSNKQSTDGYISEVDLKLVFPTAKQPRRLAADLVAADRWHRAEALTCESCIKIYGPRHLTEGWVIHDYFEYNKSAAQIEALKSHNRKLPGWLRRFILDRDGRSCRACGSDVDLTIDHVRPRVLGGNDEPTNLQILCRPCNSRKGGRAA